MFLLLALLPTLSQAQTSRMSTLQNTRKLVVTDGQLSRNHLLGTNESIMLRRVNGKLVLAGDTLTPQTATLQMKSLPRFILDEDSTAFGNKYDVDFGLLAFRRSLNVGQWNSIVVPFALTGAQVRDAFGEDTQLAALEAVTDGAVPTVEFASVDLLTDSVVVTANQHYLLKPSREPDLPEGRQSTVNYGSGKVAGPVYAIAGVTLTSGQSAQYKTLRSEGRQTTLRVRGFYAATDITATANPRYLLGDEGRFYQLTATTPQKGFRSYYEDASAEHSPVLRFYINGVGEDLSDVTGLAEVVRPADAARSAVYDLQGRRVTRPAKGFYIVGGKKVVMK